MPSFSENSQSKLDTCDPRLQKLFFAVVAGYDCTIIEGHRSKVRQDEMVRSGRSKAPFPTSKHNSSPSLAVDVGPYINNGIPWPSSPLWDDKGSRQRYIKALCQWYHFAGYVLAKAEELGIGIRWGGDWDRDHDVSDQTFDDLPHYELTGK